jgi:uncharacterized repeat protein (TIGR01451 family)
MRLIYLTVLILLIYPAAASAATQTFNFTIQNNSAFNFESGYYIIEVIEINHYSPKYVRVNLTTSGSSRIYKVYEDENPFLSSPWDRIDLRASSISENFAYLSVILPSEWGYPERYTVERPAEHKKIPNIVVTKSADKTNLNVGDIVEFRIKVENTGNGTAYNLTLAESLPTGFSRAPGSRFPPVISSELGAGKWQDLYYALKAVESGTFNIEPAVVSYASGSNRSNSLTIIVSEPLQEKSNLTTEIRLDRSTAYTGEEINAVIRITNIGKAQAKSVLIDGQPPEGMKVVEGDLRQVYESINPGEQKEYKVVLKAEDPGNYSINLRTVYNDRPAGTISRSESININKKEQNYIYIIVPIALVIIVIAVFTIKKHKEYAY